MLQAENYSLHDLSLWLQPLPLKLIVVLLGDLLRAVWLLDYLRLLQGITRRLSFSRLPLPLPYLFVIKACTFTLR